MDPQDIPRIHANLILHFLLLNVIAKPIIRKKCNMGDDMRIIIYEKVLKKKVQGRKTGDISEIKYPSSRFAWTLLTLI